MLEHPTCEHCNRPLRLDSTEARICSFECTFCADYVEGVLLGTCPNCGGGFVPRPIRSGRGLKRGNLFGNHPATPVVRHRPVDREVHAALVTALRARALQRR